MSRIYRDSSKTLLIATHRLEEATNLCNKVLVDRPGTPAGFRSHGGRDCRRRDAFRNITGAMWRRRRAMMLLLHKAWAFIVPRLPYRIRLQGELSACALSNR